MLAIVILFMLALIAVAALLIAIKARGNRRMAGQKPVSTLEADPKPARSPGLD